jgi:hypothetical protein
MIVLACYCLILNLLSIIVLLAKYTAFKGAVVAPSTQRPQVAVMPVPVLGVKRAVVQSMESDVSVTV